MLVELKQHLARVPGWLNGDARLPGQLAQLVLTGVGGDLLAEHGGDGRMYADRRPLAADVMLGPVWPANDGAAEPGPGGAQDKALRQRPDRVVVAVRLVRLEHREL